MPDRAVPREVAPEVELLLRIAGRRGELRGELPDGILEPFVQKETTSSEPIAYFAVGASDMTIEQLSWFVDDTVVKRLLAVEGMANVERNGGVEARDL